MPGTDRRDEPDELLSFGSDRWVVLGARLRRSLPVKIAVPVAAVLILLGALLVLTRHSSSTGQPVATSSSGGPTGARAVTSSPAASSSDPLSEYTPLYTVPAEDLRAFLRTKQCRVGCTANQLSGVALVRAASAFEGASPLAGGTVTRHDGTVIFVTIEALGVPDSLVHLVLRRTDARAQDRPTVQQSYFDGAHTAIVTRARGGWQLTAGLVTRGAAPPIAAALRWTASSRLPS